MAQSVFMGELSWQEYERWLAQGAAVLMLPVGALEQHGHHMSMNVDVLLPTAVCQRVAERTGALVAPAIQYGYKSQQKSGGGNHFPGTTSLDGATLSHTVRDFIREVARHGVRQLAIVNRAADGDNAGTTSGTANADHSCDTGMPLVLRADTPL
jgi:creatinine amidohydrolase